MDWLESCKQSLEDKHHNKDPQKDNSLQPHRTEKENLKPKDKEEPEKVTDIKTFSVEDIVAGRHLSGSDHHQAGINNSPAGNIKTNDEPSSRQNKDNCNEELSVNRPILKNSRLDIDSLQKVNGAGINDINRNRDQTAENNIQQQQQQQQQKPRKKTKKAKPNTDPVEDDQQQSGVEDDKAEKSKTRKKKSSGKRKREGEEEGNLPGDIVGAETKKIKVSKKAAAAKGKRLVF